MTSKEQKEYNENLYRNNFRNAQQYKFSKKYTKKNNTHHTCSIVNFTTAKTISLRTTHFCTEDNFIGSSHIDIDSFILKYEDSEAATQALIKEGYSPLPKKKWSEKAKEFDLFCSRKANITLLNLMLFDIETDEFNSAKIYSDFGTLFSYLLSYFKKIKNDTTTLMKLFQKHNVPLIDLGREQLFDD